MSVLFVLAAAGPIGIILSVGDGVPVPVIVLVIVGLVER
jgi:hypothetical protein